MKIKIAEKSDWQTYNMPFKKAKFKFERKFSKSEIENLKYGYIPQEMEERWFSYFENDTLYVHRSWTGHCIYIVKFNFSTNVHLVKVNRDKNQYTCESKEEDLRQLNRLLDFWTKPRYNNDV